MQYFEHNLAVEASWLIEQGVMSYSNYKLMAHRGNIRIVRRGCRGTSALVDYESMPERFRRKVDEIVKDPYRTVHVNTVEERITDNHDASLFFDEYLIGEDRHLPVDKRREYYADAIVLDAIRSLISGRKSKRSALGGKATRFWEKISDAVQELDRTRYPHALPANARSLERKYRQYIKEGYSSLVHKAYTAQMRNAAKVSEDNQISTLTVLMSDPRNLDNEQVARIYNTLSAHMGWKKITASTVAVWRDKMENDIYARRHGAVAYRNNKAMQVKRSAPQYPLLFWTMDGWDVELMYQDTKTDKNGHSVTTYHHRPTVVIVLDACCKYPVGYAIGTHETPALIKEALRNAARHTEKLFGQMYRTTQLQSDNYSLSTMLPTYNVSSGKVTPAAVRNAKAKIIEPWFRYFNKKYCQLQRNWSGFGVTSRKELQPNSDYINKMRKNFPDYDGVCRQVASYIEAERAELHDRYVSLFEKMPEDNRSVLTYEQYLLHFGVTTGNKSMLRGDGITLTVAGRKYNYDCFNPSFRKHASVRWEIRFDPDDMSRALAVNENESLQYMLETKYVQPMALAERKEGDYEQLRRVQEFNRNQERDISERISKHTAIAAEMLESVENKELETLRKLMIVDSDGQHKDRRNMARLGSGENTGASDIFDMDDLYDEY